jgi:glycosyltransferase involved in cell wall biosynthesis
MNAPLVSIVMPVFNAEQYIQQAIESILHQTLQDWELIIVDDGSSDKTSKIIHTLTDKRIKLVTNEQNLGIIDSLNKGVLNASGKYIARMDADDISLPTRLETQVNFLEANPHFGIVGTQMIMINSDGQRVKKASVYTTNFWILFWSLFQSPFFHPTVVVRREILRNNPYGYGASHAEDYELWSKILRKKLCLCANMHAYLHLYRLHGNSISHRNQSIQEQSRRKIQRLNLSQYVPEQYADLIIEPYMGFYPAHALQVLHAYAWLAYAFSKKENASSFQSIGIWLSCGWEYAKHIRRTIRHGIK